MTTENVQQQTEAQQAAAKATADAAAATEVANKAANEAYDATVGKPVLDEQGNPTLDDKGEQVLIKPREEAPKKEEENTGDTDERTTPKFDTQTADQVEGFLTEAGLDPSTVAKVVSNEGGKVTPEILKALQEKHGEGVASLIVDKLATLHESTKAMASAADKETYDQVAEAFKGVTEQTGEESFKELATWTKKNLSEEDVAGLNAMLKAGGMSRRLAIDSMIETFNASGDFTQPAKLLDGDNFADTGVKGIDKAGYDRELRELLNKGHDYNTSPEVAALNRRRTKSLSRGQ